MTQRRCCCGNADTVATTCPESLPTPGTGCSAAKWRVSCATSGLKGLQAGSGQADIFPNDFGVCLDCTKGSCSLQALHLGAADYADGFSEPQCVNPTKENEACTKFNNGKNSVPESSGYHIVEFTDAQYWDASPGNVTYEDQYDAVYINRVMACTVFQGCADSTQTGLFSTVIVTFRFEQSLPYWSLNPNSSDPDECIWTQQYVFIDQAYTATYQRLLMSGFALAEGAYKLVKVSCPYPRNTCGTDGTCYYTGPLDFCAPDYWSGVDYQGVSLPWHPPATVTVNRIC